VFSNLVPVEVRVLQDRDLVLTELFAEEDAALIWAREYEARLKKHGWRDSLALPSPSELPDVH
jgi:hypothetical protein